MDGWAHVGRPLGHASRGDLPPRADRAGAVSLHVVRNRSRRPPGEHVEDVPVLRSRTRIVVLLLLIEAFDLEPVEQRMSALSGERGDLVVRRPGVPLAQDLAAETAAGAYRVAHFSPDLRPTPAGQKKRLNPAQTRSALGGSTSSIRATVVRSHRVSSDGTRDRRRRMPSASASVANTRKPRSSIARVSMPEPHPRSTASCGPTRTWVGPRATALEVLGPRTRRNSRPRWPRQP